MSDYDSAPLDCGEMKAPKLEQRTKRRFLGKIDGFVDKQEAAYQKKHLKSYLRGGEQFLAGYETNSITGQKRPVYYKVKQEYY